MDLSETAADERIVLLDVRTPEEYAAGHLEGARLIDYLAGDVHAAIPSLDPELGYLVYCRAGHRSGFTVELLEQAGFTNAANLGSLEEAALATGLPIVRSE